MPTLHGLKAYAYGGSCPVIGIVLAHKKKTKETAEVFVLKTGDGKRLVSTASMTRVECPGAEEKWKDFFDAMKPSLRQHIGVCICGHGTTLFDKRTGETLQLAAAEMTIFDIRRLPGGRIVRTVDGQESQRQYLIGKHKINL